MKQVWIRKILSLLKVKGSIVDHAHVHWFEQYTTGKILSVKYAPSYKNVIVGGRAKETLPGVKPFQLRPYSFHSHF